MHGRMAPESPPAGETQYVGQGHSVAREPAKAQCWPSLRPPAAPKLVAKGSSVGHSAAGQVGLRAMHLRCHRCCCRRSEPKTRSARPCSRERRRIQGRRSGHSSGHRGRRVEWHKDRRAHGSHGLRSPAHRSSGASHRPPGTCHRWRRHGRHSRPSHARSVALRSRCGSCSAGRGLGPGRAHLWGSGVRGAAGPGNLPRLVSQLCKRFSPVPIRLSPSNSRASLWGYARNFLPAGEVLD